MSTRVLPGRLDEDEFDAALTTLREQLGPDAVIADPDALREYADPYPVVDGERHAPSCALHPSTVEQVQAVVRIANACGIGLWTVSCGKNLGYGGSAPRERGCAVLCLDRMNSIIEVNDEYCYAIVEPGVTFFDLYEYVREHDLAVWPSCPALGWGSVVGNTLDRGWGYTPLGDHSNAQCGMEVVLPDGDVLRTGMGAIGDSPVWPLFKGGYGPAPDQMFMQSSLGIVTKMGIWLYPRPEAFMAVTVQVQDEPDLPVLVDTLSRLRRHEVLQNNPLIGNLVRQAAAHGPRSQFYDGPGAIPDDVLAQIQRDLGVGYWSARLGFYGDEQMIATRYAKLREAFADIPGARVDGRLYRGEDGRGLLPEQVDPVDRSGQIGYPSLAALESVRWRGHNGAHIGFAPILPPSGREVYDFYLEAKRISAKHGFDFYAGFHNFPRHLTHINMIIFDQDDAAQKRAARDLFADLVTAAHARGYSEYRAHVEFMDLVADQYDFNDHALRRFNGRIKDALDPNGVLSPGKQGVWPGGAAARHG